MHCDQSIGVGLWFLRSLKMISVEIAAIERRGEFHDQATRVPANAIVAFVVLKNSAASWSVEGCFKCFQICPIGGIVKVTVGGSYVIIRRM